MTQHGNPPQFGRHRHTHEMNSPYSQHVLCSDVFGVCCHTALWAFALTCVFEHLICVTQRRYDVPASGGLKDVMVMAKTNMVASASGRHLRDENKLLIEALPIAKSRQTGASNMERQSRPPPTKTNANMTRDRQRTSGEK